MLSPVMTVAEVDDFLEREFPQLNRNGRIYILESIGPETADMRFDAGEDDLRPGGTVSGPAMMALVDLAAYTVVLAHIGPVGLAVTTNLNINFLRKPNPGRLKCRARLIKLGKRLAVIDASVTSNGIDRLVAHATLTYSIPAPSS
ncbi:MAG: PaaI family thioesterase [Pseudomonadota bacterium]